MYKIKLVKYFQKNPSLKQINDWKKYKQKLYDTSDGAFITKNNLIRITGRTDDVMKAAGHRLATAELENAINDAKKLVRRDKKPLPGQPACLFLPPLNHFAFAGYQ